jgi:NAD(P)-dependent dehydrogenase (short-subunit alcohol dehydrogenase family)
MSSRIVVVTGGSGGLGTAVVEAFRRLDDEVVTVSRSSGEFAADLADPAATDGVFRKIQERHGRIDVLVHTAGAFTAGDAATSGPELWQRMLAVNLHTAINAFHAVLPSMRERRSGRIIATGSRAGVQLSAGLAAYSVSKAALHALVQTVALEVKDSGITANAVLPGTIDTEANRAWGTPEQITRWVKPDSIAAAIAWLASDEASDVNGVLLPVYGQS